MAFVGGGGGEEGGLFGRVGLVGGGGGGRVDGEIGGKYSLFLV